jgi:hypothetical protein
MTSSTDFVFDNQIHSLENSSLPNFSSPAIPSLDKSFHAQSNFEQANILIIEPKSASPSKPPKYTSIHDSIPEHPNIRKSYRIKH